MAVTRWFGIGLLLAWAAFAAPGGAAAQDLRPLIRQVTPSIVGLGTFLATRSPKADLRGTGFVVADGLHVVTNSHVVARRSTLAKGERIVALIGRGKTIEVRETKLLGRDAVHDAALLRISGEPLPALTLGNEKQVAAGLPVAFTGFPIGAVLGLYPVTHRGIVSAITPSAVPQRDTEHLDPKFIRQLRNPYMVFQLDATAYPGNSGGPLYEQKTGRVVGIVSSVFVKDSKEKVFSAIGNPSGITYAIPIGYTKTLMRKAGLADAR